MLTELFDLLQAAGAIAPMRSLRRGSCYLQATGGGTFRVVIREFEDFDADPAPQAIAAELTQRNVFLDIVPLPVD
jgi:hypothetical protein